MSDLLSTDPGFDSQSDRLSSGYHLDGLQTDKSSRTRFITNTNINSTFHPPEYVNRVEGCRVADNIVGPCMAGDAP